MTLSPAPGGREITRRKFITGFAAIVAGGAVAAGSSPPIDALAATAEGQDDGWVTLGLVSQLVPGMPAAFAYERRLKDGWTESVQTGIAYAITHDGHNVRVFTNACTHGGCRVTWDGRRRVFICPCHNGLFNADGLVIAGPPQRPLEQLASRVVNGQLQVHF